MSDSLLSVGVDVGTTSTQMVVSRLRIENRASGFAVPQMEITERQILYKSPVYFTPLAGESRVDGLKIRELVMGEYEKAGICREQVDTGAVIITGETSRKENARTVVENLSDLAGEFVVATAGPDLESVLAAKGSGAADYARYTGKRVLHMDIGGGTSNLALIQGEKICATGCLNVGGRLIKMDETGRILYISPVLEKLCKLKAGDRVNSTEVLEISRILASGLEMAAGLRPATALLEQLWTREQGHVWEIPDPRDLVISFSGGVADCIAREESWLEFGDMGPLLGQAIRESRLCGVVYRLGSETIRATVIGAGCHSAQLSGSTVYYRDFSFPVKDLPVVTLEAEEQEGKECAARIREKLARSEGAQTVLALPGMVAPAYKQVTQLAKAIREGFGDRPILICLQADMAKALGHALALEAESGRPIFCIDRVALTEGDYLDVGIPVGPAVPVVVKTLVLGR